MSRSRIGLRSGRRHGALGRATVRIARASGVAACLGLIAAGTAGARTGAALELVQRYSPIIAVHPQKAACGPGEPYRPTVVGLVLGNRDVVLRNARGRIVRRAPSAQDLFDATTGDYIDLPGDPLKPGCVYERDFRRWYGKRHPSVYARTAIDPRHPERLALQFWFFYTFNDFTNKHEGDWEMVQLDFQAGTAQEALAIGPYQIDLAQHAGGERGEWTQDPKLSKQGSHPIVYVATGAHAAYFQSRLYLGKGGSTVFGCDDTRQTSLRSAVRPILLPGGTVARSSPFAWIDFRGRWGQREAGINNGPLGPASSEQWTHPIAWADGLRTGSLVVPGGNLLGLSVTRFFCGAVGVAATAFNWATLHTTVFFILAGLVLVALLVAITRTTWRPGDTQPLRRPRAAGQIIRASRRVYWEHRWTFAGIGLIFIPVSGLAAGLQWLVFHLTRVDQLVALDGRRGAGTVFLALLIGDLAGAFATAAVTAAVASALSELDLGRRVSPLEAYRLAFGRLRSLSAATALQLGLSLVLALTVVGIPVVVYRFIRTSVFIQACVLDDRSARDSLRVSRQLTRRHWWRTFTLVTVVDAVAVLSGPLLGVGLLLISPQSLSSIDLTGAVIYALTVPFASIALTLYYFDLQCRISLSAITSSPKTAPAAL